jgi:uncharacterized protein (TIGR00106 family)
MPIMEISVVPLGTHDPSVSKWVKKAVSVLKQESTILYQLTAMGTIIEAGSVEELLTIARKMHDATMDEVDRVVTTIKIDDRKDRKMSIEEKTRFLSAGSGETKPEVQEWATKKSESFLRKIGIREGQNILDFGCRSGVYTLPAGRIVGEEGRVYAIDKEKEQLDMLEQETKLHGLTNIEVVKKLDWKNEIDKESIDVILLFDVLHPGYFPSAEDRKKLLMVFYRILKANGLISVLPTHVEEHNLPLERFIADIENAGFQLEARQKETLVHDNMVEEGEILNFRKRQAVSK